MSWPCGPNTREHAGNIKYLIYTLEHALWADDAEHAAPLGAAAEHAPEKMVIIIDFSGWTLSTAPPMKTSRETLSILQAGPSIHCSPRHPTHFDSSFLQFTGIL